MSQSALAFAPTLAVVDGHPTTTSNEVALHFGKQHKDVLEKIATLSREVGHVFTERNFSPSEYTDSTGRMLPCYRLTRDGFALLAMGFTGKRALTFKLAYIDAFNRMEDSLREKTALAIPAPSLHFRRWMISFNHNGKEQVTEIPKDAALICPDDISDVHEFVGMVPLALLPKVIDSANQRLATFLNYINKKAVKP